MYQSAITPMAVAAPNQIGIGLYGVGHQGAHALLHAVDYQNQLVNPGIGQFGVRPSLPGLGLNQGYGQGYGQFGMPNFGMPNFGMPNFGPMGPGIGMLPGLGQQDPTSLFGGLGQAGVLGNIGQYLGQGQFNPFTGQQGQGQFSPSIAQQGQFAGLPGQLGTMGQQSQFSPFNPMPPYVGGRQITRIYIPTPFGMLPFDVLI